MPHGFETAAETASDSRTQSDSDADQQTLNVLVRIEDVVSQCVAALQAVLDTRLLCIACAREQIAAANAGVSPPHLPPVNLANVIENGNGICGNHIGTAQRQQQLFVPAGFSR